jgi:hypothetical protein
MNFGASRIKGRTYILTFLGRRSIFLTLGDQDQVKDSSCVNEQIHKRYLANEEGTPWLVPRGANDLAVLEGR